MNAVLRCNLRREVHCAKTMPRMQMIVRPAKQPDIPRVGRTLPGERLAVVNLEKGAGLAATAIDRNERTAPPISIMSCAAYRRGQVSSALTAELQARGFDCRFVRCATRDFVARRAQSFARRRRCS